MAGERKEQLIKSRKRVRDHGEVFTPEWLVNAMCDLVADECLRPDARFLEPACGDGNFLAVILLRKLAALTALERFIPDIWTCRSEAILPTLLPRKIPLVTADVICFFPYFRSIPRFRAFSLG